MTCRPAVSVQGTGEAKVGAKMDGLLTRDLQLRPEAKFAFFLRPLPARAKQLSGQATLFRRRLLKVDTVPKARRRYAPLPALLYVAHCLGHFWHRAERYASVVSPGFFRLSYHKSR